MQQHKPFKDHIRLQVIVIQSLPGTAKTTRARNLRQIALQQYEDILVVDTDEFIPCKFRTRRTGSQSTSINMDDAHEQAKHHMLSENVWQTWAHSDVVSGLTTTISRAVVLGYKKMLVFTNRYLEEEIQSLTLHNFSDVAEFKYAYCVPNESYLHQVVSTNTQRITQLNLDQARRWFNDYVAFLGRREIQPGFNRIVSDLDSCLPDSYALLAYVGFHTPLSIDSQSITSAEEN